MMLSMYQCLVHNGDSETLTVTTAICCKLNILDIIGGHVPEGLRRAIKQA